MVQRSRGRGDTIPHAAEVLAAMGACRRRLIDAQSEVRPFGTAYHALAMVTTAIDSAARFITGQRDFYATGGSAGHLRRHRASGRDLDVHDGRRGYEGPRGPEYREQFFTSH